MTIRSELLFPVKVAIWIVSLAVCGALVLLVHDMGLGFARASSGVPANLSKSDAEPNIERTAQNQLHEKIKTLEAENARLKQELAYFNSNLPTNSSAGASGIAIQKLALEPVQPNQLRFSALVMKSGSEKQRFSGNVQFVVAVQQGDQTVNLVFPNETSLDHDKYKLGFKHDQRLEGVLKLPEGAIAKNVEMRIMENGLVRAQKTIDAI